MKVDILAFAAHPDDVEISCAGTLMKHIALGKKVVIVDLTQGELGSRGTIETRAQEAKDAAEIIGLTDRVNLKLADGFFELNEPNKMKLIEQIRRFQPEVVLANSISDRHPDHGRSAQLESDACFLAGLTKIQTSWNGESQAAWRPKAVYHYIQDVHLKPDFVVDITPFVEQKIAALKAYKTQFYDPTSNEPVTPISGSEFFDFLKGRWMDYGRSIGALYGEGYTVRRPMGIEDLTQIR